MSVALAPKEREELNAAAEAEQIPTSAYVRRAALREARASRDDHK